MATATSKSINPRPPTGVTVNRGVVAALACVATLVAGMTAGCSGSEKSGDVDLVVKNGQVYTVDDNRSWAEAIAVDNGEIIYVGDNAGAEKYERGAAKVVDLEGKMLTPGFIDGHNHAYLMAESLFWLSLNPHKTVEAKQTAIREFRAEDPGMRQLRGVGWDDIDSDARARGVLPRQLIDEAVSDIPVAFIENSHHTLLVNSKALELAGITKDTPDPAGATIVRDPVTGEPTGELEEFGAENLVISKLPQPDFTVEQYRNTILEWQKVAAADGITSTFVPVHYPTETLLQAFKQLDDEKKLTVRFDLAQWADENKGPEQIAHLQDMRDKYRGDKFKLDSVKIFADGVGDAKLVWKQDVLNETVAAADKAGFRVYVHAIGNVGFYPEANVLDAFEYAARQNGTRDSRHAITHLDWVRPEDLTRFNALGVIAVPQPAWFGKGWYDDAPAPEANNAMIFRSYLDAGVTVSSSSDFPSTDTFTRDMYPLTGLEAGMTRLDVDTATEADLDKAKNPQERAELADLIESYTMGGATLIFAEQERGSIEVGKKADFVVLDRNLFDLPKTSVGEAKILATYFEGQEIVGSN
ncbi:amidohydrolase [Nocardia coubleae]|uniref:Amidohydrolase n=1 Tax=Nocardia coubleae TaxID=356147 RepID=A0A846W147_9NOCA|nr:amidohydrolase [Nocardia coubleae]NKX86851.1 amidohydrolase [Nocardia coubleae]